MSAPLERSARPGSPNDAARRIVTAAAVSGLIFLLLWPLAFSLLTSLLIAGGFCALLVAASTISDLIAAILDAIATAVCAVLAAIAAVFAAIFGFFGI